MGDAGIAAAAQDVNSLTGKILRLDVDHDAFPDAQHNYAIPLGNPFAGPAAGADEIFALGLRNPWRDSFDRGLGQFFVADVGAVTWEEVNLGLSGANYGWPNTEGPFDPAAFPAFTNPIHAYAHNGSGRSITGGYVFRGPDSDGLQGQYFFADFITGQVWTLHNQGGAWTATERTGQIAASAGTIANISSFGEDGRGNLYLTDFGGDIFRLDPLLASADRADVLLGGAGDDMLLGGAGDDRLAGEAGEDVAIGGLGDDWLDGGPGADRLDGGPGSDTVSYVAAQRVMLINLTGQVTTDGIDTDTLFSIENAIGTRFNDDIYGNDSDNVLDGGVEGSDQIFGGIGADTASYATSARRVLINLTGEVTADGFNTDTLSSIENAIGSRFDDDVYGNDVDNVLDGGSGGSDQIFGGGGADTVSLAFAVRAQLINLTGQVTTDGIETDTLSSIENAIGSRFADDIFGNDLANMLDGGSGGSDRIFGGGGSDTASHATALEAMLINLTGQVTTDGIDTDTLSSIENAIGSAFNDDIYGNDSDNVLDGGVEGSDQIFGGIGTDTASYATSARGVLINLTGEVTADGFNTDTLSSIENAIGSRFDDDVYGNDVDNVLDGGSGGSDQIFGGGGVDTVSHAFAVRAQLINLTGQVTTDGIETDTLSSIENAIGSRFDDDIFGDGLANILDGGSGGSDRIFGGGGSDTASHATALEAMLINLAGQVTTNGIDTDTLSSIENAIGSAFNDAIYGDGIANVLDGGAGADSLFGGGDNDTFVFRRGQAAGDTVVDFAGNDAGAGDALQFVGYGPGATFVQLDGTHWRINSSDGQVHETITVQNGAAVHTSDVLFV